MKPFNHAGEFQSLRDNSQLSRLTVRNAGITIFGQSLVFAIQLIGTIILARLLTPADFGLVTMVTTFSLLLASFGLSGFTEAVLQTDKINHSLASNLFWVNLAGGVLLAGAFAASGSLLARFYGNPQIRNISVGLSLTIFFSIVPVIHLSLLRRAMRFAAVSLNDIIGRLSYVLIAILTAHLGWGYWALVVGAIVQPLVLCFGTWILCPWAPGFPRQVSGTGKLLRYSISVYGRFCLNYLNANTDNLLVGWRFGSYSLGIYKKAYDLFVLPAGQLLSPILAVVVTTLSRKKNDIDDYKRYLLKGLCLVAFVGMAISAILTLNGKDVVRLLLGPKWSEAGIIFEFFAPGIGFALLCQTTGWIHLSLGTTGRWLRWTIVESMVTLLSFLLGLHWGPAGVAGAWTFSFCILIVPGFWYAVIPITLPITSLLKALWRYSAAALIAGIACAAIQTSAIWSTALGTYPGAAGSAVRIVSSSTLFTALYLVTIVALFGSFEALREFARLLPDLRPGNPSLASTSNG